jgi:hypothetical protein
MTQSTKGIKYIANYEYALVRTVFGNCCRLRSCNATGIQF